MEFLQLFGVCLALVAALSWGIAAIIYKTVLKDNTSVLTSNIIRGVFSVPFIAFMAILFTGFDSFLIIISITILPILILSSIMSGLGEICFLASLQRSDASKVQPIASTYPFFTTVLVVTFGFEKITIFTIIGTILVLLGLTLIFKQDIDEKEPSPNIKTNDDRKNGFILALGAAVFWSGAIFTIRLILLFPEVEVLPLATIRFLVFTLFITTVWLGRRLLTNSIKTKDKFIINLSRKDVLALGIGGIISWGIGGVAFFSSIDLIGAARSTPISSINPMVTVILGIFFLHERLTIKQLIGALFITSGSIFISLS